MTTCREVNFNGGNFINGGPEPPRLWSRFTLNCSYYNNYSKEQLDMRRKAEILKYKNNSSKLSKKMAWSQLAKGINSYKKQSWATQNDLFTDPNTRKLEKNNNSLICRRNPIVCNLSTASNVPGKSAILCYDKSVPLVNYITPRQYKAGGTKWPQSSSCMVTDGNTTDGRCVVTDLAIKNQ
jgi:hypothetical protein